MKRLPAQKPSAPKNTMIRPGPHGKISDNGSNPANESSNLPTGRQSLFGGPFGDNPNITKMDKIVVEDLLNEALRSTTPGNLGAHTPRSTSPGHAPAQTPPTNLTNLTNITSPFSTRVSKSNPTHTELFNTLSPSQSLGRKRKLTKIRNKLKEKTVDELTQIYNSTDDPGFRKLMSEVYYENCMERLDDWERKL
ncbi:hypothetical protein KCU77_g3464, partial [Aureobasidium melanogenum]